MYFIQFKTKWSKVRVNTSLTSGVASRYPAPGGKNILALPLTKITEFEVKNRCKSAEETKAKHLL